MRKILAMALGGALLAPAITLADGDPASDVLLGENVFYPYTPPVSNASKHVPETSIPYTRSTVGCLSSKLSAAVRREARFLSHS